MNHFAAKYGFTCCFTVLWLSLSANVNAQYCWNLQNTTCCQSLIDNPQLHLCLSCDPGGRCCPYVFDTNDPMDTPVHSSSGWDSTDDFPEHSGSIACDYHDVSCSGGCHSLSSHHLVYCVGYDTPAYSELCTPW